MEPLPIVSVDLDDFGKALFNFSKLENDHKKVTYYLNLFYSFSLEPKIGMCPTFYHTLSYRKDLIYHKMLVDFVKEHK